MDWQFVWILDLDWIYLDNDWIHLDLTLWIKDELSRISGKFIPGNECNLSATTKGNIKHTACVNVQANANIFKAFYCYTYVH